MLLLWADTMQIIHIFCGIYWFNLPTPAAATPNLYLGDTSLPDVTNLIPAIGGNRSVAVYMTSTGNATLKTYNDSEGILTLPGASAAYLIASR